MTKPSPYLCNNAPRGLNGAEVHHNADPSRPVVARTVWAGSAACHPIQCGYAHGGYAQDDTYCSDCAHCQ